MGMSHAYTAQRSERPMEEASLAVRHLSVWNLTSEEDLQDLVTPQERRVVLDLVEADFDAAVAAAAEAAA